ncbi:MAG: hypothetical protein US74_C0047G0010 [Parcubacteria group bacterium GW2011_GWA2_38_13]|nr:MAG: hypothetical protein US74_C0047G0010 [Parcubacteria group bacterium GW2011_GWA2_38_13]
MENSNFHNPDFEAEFEELLQSIEAQKSDIRTLKEKIQLKLKSVAHQVRDAKKEAARRIERFEADMLEAKNLLAKQELEIQRLTKFSEQQEIDAERLIKFERIVRIIKTSCVKSHVSSRKFWTIRRFAAIHFMEFIAKILNRYKILTQDEFDMIFPQKAAKKVISLAIKIPTEDEKKKKLRDWKRLWLRNKNE